MLGPLGPMKLDRRRPPADDLDYLLQPADASFVDEPERLEAHMRGTHQRQAVFLRAAMRALVWQHHAVFVRLQAQRRDEVAAPAAVEGDLVDVHRRLVGLEKAVALPL